MGIYSFGSPSATRGLDDHHLIFRWGRVARQKGNQAMKWFRIKLSELFLSIAVVLLPNGSKESRSLAACLELFLTLQSQGFSTLNIEKDQ